MKIKKYLFVTNQIDNKDEDEKEIIDKNYNIEGNKTECILYKKEIFKNNEFDYCNKCMGILCEQCIYNGHGRGKVSWCRTSGLKMRYFIF